MNEGAFDVEDDDEGHIGNIDLAKRSIK